MPPIGDRGGADDQRSAARSRKTEVVHASGAALVIGLRAYVSARARHRDGRRSPATVLSVPALFPALDAADTERITSLAWYHTIDVTSTVTTPGWFDLRHALPLIPFPDVRGKRCLDVGTWDGFFAYELERRGAAEVVALDVPDLGSIDYPPAVRAQPGFDPLQTGEQPRPAGFRLLHELIGSRVQWVAGNIYDLDPAELGTFDVVVVGSLLVHLRDPVRALDAVRSVTRGWFVLSDYVHAPLDLLGWRRPWFELRGESADFQWWLASTKGLRQLLDVGGFDVTRQSPRYLLRFGPIMGDRGTEGDLRTRARRLAHRALAGDNREGHLHRAFLAKPRF